jgi:hypothetical protein
MHCLESEIRGVCAYLIYSFLGKRLWQFCFSHLTVFTSFVFVISTSAHDPFLLCLQNYLRQTTVNNIFLK